MRVTSKRKGSSKTASSRFAELYQSTTLSPAFTARPPISVSRVTVRRKWITGLAQRTISSIAVGAMRSKSAAHLRRSSGWSLSAFMPWLIALRVVSLPATTSSTKKDASSAWVSASPSISAERSWLVRSSVGLFSRSAASSFMIPVSSWPAWSAAAIGLSPGATYSGSPRPSTTFVFSKTKAVWLSGMPMRSQTISSGSGAAISVTKSHSPFSITRSTVRAARCCTLASMRPSARGVKPRETMRRSRPWRGSSMLIIEPKNSLNDSGRSGIWLPFPEQKRSALRLACSTSACRASAQ